MVWKSIYRLIVPEKKMFLLVVLISLLSTGVSLIEPLIYREAINDIAGLFVRQAREDTKKEYGVEVEEEDDPISAFIGRFTSPADSVADTVEVPPGHFGGGQCIGKGKCASP